MTDSRPLFFVIDGEYKMVSATSDEDEEAEALIGKANEPKRRKRLTTPVVTDEDGVVVSPDEDPDEHDTIDTPRQE